MSKNPDKFAALVVSATRGHIEVVEINKGGRAPLSASHSFTDYISEPARSFANIVPVQTPPVKISITLSHKDHGIVVGDILEIEGKGGDGKVVSRHPRVNVMVRASDNRTKPICSNLGRVYIITAPPPLLNYHFIDRVIVAARAASIPCSIIFNKVDLIDLDRARSAVETYRQHEIVDRILFTSTVSEPSPRELVSEIESQYSECSEQVILLCGVSGVGKSSLINCLIPGVGSSTQSTSRKTGQGRQTTTKAEAHAYLGEVASLNGRPPIFVVDAPGIQNYGISHLVSDNIASYFPDIDATARLCQFANCKHIREPQCGVLEAVEAGELSDSRYRSYLSILDELEMCKKKMWK